jgi:HD-GYP domain-containing protein (c-di-GMP phosphodiesterase class II)
MSKADVLAIMTKGAGKQFDEVVLAVFLDALNQGKLVQAVLENADGKTESSDSTLVNVSSFSDSV